jgi:hypothetical protein
VSVVRPEFRPTLPELVQPWARAHPRAARAGAVLLLVAVITVLGLVVRGGEGTHSAVVKGPIVSFNLIYPDGLVRVAPGRDAALRLQSPPGARHTLAFTVRPIALPAYRGDVNGYLPLVSSHLIDDMRRSSQAFALRGEGRARINESSGYGMLFQTRVAGRLVYGRRLLLLPDETRPRRGVDILLLAASSPAVPNADAVGNAGPLKTALRSFRFGTERP